MKVKVEILKLLDECTIPANNNLNIVYLPEGQLERKTYMEINKCLELMGGKWNRKEKGHIFEEDPSEIFDTVLLTGEVIDTKKEFQFFETPKELAIQMIEMLDLKDSDSLLEASAGHGAIVDEIKNWNGTLSLNELNEKNYNVLLSKGYSQTTNHDFLEVNLGSFDKIIQNPPFSKQQDIDHILRAYDHLKTGGILVSVAGEGIFFRENKKSVAFRKFLQDNNAEVIKNPDATFKGSGTLVTSRLIKIIK